MRRCATGTPADHERDRRSTSRTYGCELSTALRRASAVVSVNANSPAFVPAASNAPTDRPNEDIAARSWSLSPERCLNRASSFQINLGIPSSSRTDRASSPSFRATENRNSSLADDDGSAASLHQSGHAASIAGSLRPRVFSLPRNRSASVNQASPPHGGCVGKVQPMRLVSLKLLLHEHQMFSNTRQALSGPPLCLPCFPLVQTKFLHICIIVVQAPYCVAGAFSGTAIQSTDQRMYLQQFAPALDHILACISQGHARVWPILVALYMHITA